MSLASLLLLAITMHDLLLQERKRIVGKDHVACFSDVTALVE